MFILYFLHSFKLWIINCVDTLRMRPYFKQILQHHYTVKQKPSLECMVESEYVGGLGHFFTLVSRSEFVSFPDRK